MCEFELTTLQTLELKTKVTALEAEVLSMKAAQETLGKAVARFKSLIDLLGVEGATQVLNLLTANLKEKQGLVRALSGEILELSLQYSEAKLAEAEEKESAEIVGNEVAKEDASEGAKEDAKEDANEVEKGDAKEVKDGMVLDN